MKLGKYVKVILVLLILGLLINNAKKRPSTLIMQPTCDLYKTVAHIDLSYRDDLQLVYVDTENDLAYYMYLADKRNLSIGDKVYLNTGIECIVTYIDAYGFAFTSDAYAHQGLSGTAVRDVEGNQLGYISRTMNADEIYCIWS